MLRTGFIFLALALGIAVTGFASRVVDALLTKPIMVSPLPRVAHAGGGIKGRTYTNSKEAILSSLEKGFEWLEIDFTWTSDGDLVCLHDWGGNFSRLFGYSVEGALSSREFEEEREGKEFTFLTLRDLAEMMETEPALTIVTDVKSNNLNALKVFARVLPDAGRRVVPQVYLPVEYEAAKELGYEKIIWTLYRYPNQRDIEKITEELRGRTFVAVCMSRDRVKDGHALRLSELGVSTFAHTINDPEEWRDLRDNWGITQVYTDFLPAEEID